MAVEGEASDSLRVVLDAARPDDPIELHRAYADAARRMFAREQGPVMFGRYVLLRRVGSGGGGSVHAAYDPQLDRRVAIKLLHPTRDEARAHAKMLREAKALARVTHPNVVAIHDVGTFGSNGGHGLSGVYIVMEYLEGPTLTAWASGAARSWRDVVDVYLGAGKGLSAAHARGLVHRDFKPGNVIVDADGRPRVIDFGLARRGVEGDGSSEDGDTQGHSARLAIPCRRGDAQAPDIVLDSEVEQTLTRAGWARGTLPYMPPEQQSGGLVDARSDQYAFCVSLFESLHGARPFRGDDPEALLACKRAGKVSPVPRGVRVPSRVLAIVTRGLHPDPSRRFGSMQQLLSRLERARRPLVSRVGSVVSLACVATMGVLGMYVQEDPCEGGEAELAGAWDESIRERLAATFAASSNPAAAEAWDNAHRELDGYAAAWVSARDRACRGAVRSGVVASSPALACLERRRAALRGVATALEHAPDPMLLRAPEVVATLSAPATCVERSLRGPNSQDDGIESSSESAADLAAIDAWIASSELTTASRALDRLRRSAGQDDDRLRAEISVREARLQLALRHDEASEASARAALLLAERARELALAVDAMTEIALVVGERLGRHDEALRLIEHADARVGPSSDGPAVRARLKSAAARVHLAAGAPARAQLLLLDAIPDAARHLGDEAPLLAELHNLIGVAYDRQHLNEAALEHYDAALAIRSARFGETNPATATSRGNRGVILGRLGRHEEAVDELSAAVDAMERVLGPEHPNLAWVLDSLGFQLDETLDPRGIAHHERALEIRERALGTESLEVARSHDALAYSLNLHGAPEEGLRHARRAVELRGATPRHPDYARALTNEASAMHLLGRHRESIEVNARAREILEALGDGAQMPLARVLRDQGVCHLELGEPELASAPLETAIELAQRLEPGSPSTAVIAFALARALGTGARAKRLERDAVATLGSTPLGRSELADLEARLGPSPTPHSEEVGD